jgi:hypothetical protein
VRPAQFVSLERTHASNVKVLRDRDVARMTPKFLLRATLSMNCAYALFTDWLYNDATEYGSAYKMEQVYPIGKRLFGLFLEATQNFKPGDQYALVDVFASMLKLTGWYEWGPARYSAEEEKPAPLSQPAGGQSRVTDPALLKQKGTSSVAYCLSALQLFEGMSDEEVKTVAFEIGMAGTDGIDYASSEDRYTLRALPGRRFSGLQLLSMMYVGFKRIDPGLSTGIPLDSEYGQALKMFERLKNTGK